jgi:hypothetical protein
MRLKVNRFDTIANAVVEAACSIHESRSTIPAGRTNERP